MTMLTKQQTATPIESRWSLNFKFIYSIPRLRCLYLRGI